MEKLRKYTLYLVPILIIGCISSYWLCCFRKSPVTTVILVRHADRLGNQDQIDPVLGEARAQELARVLDETNISAIYVSNANRTQQTASPLATQLGITPAIYDGTSDASLADMANEIKANHRGKVVLVVGHSDTVPKTIHLLGITPQPPNIPHEEYDNLFILTLAGRSPARLVKLEYGAHTP